MNRTLHLYSLIILLFGSISLASAQKINVNNSDSLEDLIVNNLINGCVEVTNITSSINGNSYGFPSYGQFTRGNSNFPFESGMILSTGNALSAGNSSLQSTLSDGSTSWGSDPDLEAALGVSNTLNATSIEFDIISTSNQLRFNYILASEEYEGVNSCQFSDGFAFLIKETNSPNAYQNIALIPNTTLPVNTGNIHPQLGPNCPAVNQQYFDGYNRGDTNYQGRTTVLTASATIVPYVQYHIKLVIADQSDYTFDSSVFIQGDSFSILDLGEDIETCFGFALLDADIQNPSATYKWFLNNNEMVGQTNATLNAIENGTYKVEVSVPLGNSICVEEDEIHIILNTEEAINPISNYELCDDVSNGINVETFDLSSKNTEVLNNIPITFSNPTFSYHLSDSDARNNINAITAPIQNTTNPQTIYVRIVDQNTGCLGYTTFNLRVNPAPIIHPPTILNVCDNDNLPDGYTIIDLTVKNDEITGGNNSLLVTYHYSSSAANSGSNPITTYINSSFPSSTVYVRVLNPETGCVNTTTLDIHMDISPLVNTDIQFIDACDTDLDGFANFNLTEVIDDVLNGLTGVTPSFHQTYPDALSGTNPISNPSSYANNQSNVQSMYIRVEDDVTGCSTIVPLQIHTNLLLTGTALGDYAMCDVETSSGLIDFDLGSVETHIANTLPDIVVTFFDSENDRNANTNPLPKTSLYQVSNTEPKTLYLRINNGVCEEFADIRLIVNPILLFNPPAPLTYCDDDDDVFDGTINVHLRSFDTVVSSGNSEFMASYFASENDANLNLNPLPDFYTVSGTQTIWVRLTHNDTGCSAVSSFEIQIIPAPETTTPSPIVICDDDGFSVINLENSIPDIVPNLTGLTVDFFTSIDDAEANINALTIPARRAFNASTQMVYVRVTSVTCYKIVPLSIIVNTLPVIPNISMLQMCEDDTNQTEAFVLFHKDAEILNGQTGKEVYYFVNATDAQNGNIANAIDKYNDYYNATPTQTIHVRVENISDPSCFATSSFTIRVSSNPVYNTAFEDYFQCDDRSNDRRHTFNLSEKIAEIKQGSPDPNSLNVSFHLTLLDAQYGIGALPLQYTNAINPQTLYVRIESTDTQCVILDELGINIVPSPNLTDPNPLEVCDTYTNIYDGIGLFNLNDASYQNLDRIQTIIVHYFENYEDINQDDALDNSLAISNPTNYISGSKTIYIKVTNTLTNCFTTLPLQLVVNAPPKPNNVGTLALCDNDFNYQDLSVVEPMLLENYQEAYFEFFTDNSFSASIPGNLFNYTIIGDYPIYVRITDIITLCEITTSFVLRIKETPVANTPPDLVACDDDYDGFYEFDLTQNTNIILGAQNPNNHMVTYYNDLANAEAGISALNNFYSAMDGEIIYARLQNNLDCYDIVEFTLNVNPLPMVAVNDVIPLCVNDLPLIINAETGHTNDTYLWSTGATTPQIALGLGDAGNNYWVTVTRAYNNGPDCSYTQFFSVIESAIADINFTTTVNFADPNSITVDVSGIGDYVYILDGGEPQTSNVFENVTLGSHTVTVRDLNGCEDASQSVTVFDIPKFVTPNNDGYFDTWHVVDFRQLPGTVVYIYDRYGKLLKTLNHTSSGWDGTFNGGDMPADDYWFVANIIQQGNAFTIKGHFALKR